MDSGPLQLRDYLSILWARKWTIIAIVVTTIAVALAYSFRQTPVYTSSAEVIVLPVSFDPRVSSAASTAPNMLKEIQVANSALVERRASLHLTELDITRGTMSVEEVDGAETLVFISEASNRRAAQATAQAYADSYLELRRRDLIDELERAREQYESQIDVIDTQLEETALALQTAQGETEALLTARYSALLSERSSHLTTLNGLATPENVQAGRVLRPAERPSSPSAPDNTRNGLIALVVGLALGIGAALLRDRLDERIRGREELELRSGAPVLALIPRGYSKRNEIPITLSRPTSEAAEAFKALQVRLIHAVNHRSAASVIIVTSSLAGEGKTSVIANLGVALATTGKRVVMVSADLRRPRLQTYFRGSDFQMSGGAGLTEVLSGKRRAQDVLSTTGTKNLWVLHTGGKADSTGPLELLGSESMIHLLAELRDFADFILIDTPPLLTSSDVVILASLADGVLFVVDPRLAQGSNIERARRELELIGAPLIGIVVNKHDPRRFRAYGSGHSYHGDGYEQGSGDAAGGTLPAKPADSEYRTPFSPSDRETGDVPHP
jgi:capsular exopolysaccharide synthesis family protein